jgi:hypothetical protein
MGQKVNPIILRLGKTKPDISTWSDFSGKSAELVLQDLQLRDFLANLLKSRGILLRHCSIARSNQKIELDLDLYFSYIFSKQAKFLWARSLFQSIKKKYTKIHKIKDIRTLSSTLKAFRYIQGSDKKFKHKIKFSRRCRCGIMIYISTKKGGNLTCSNDEIHNKCSHIPMAGCCPL